MIRRPMVVRALRHIALLRIQPRRPMRRRVKVSNSGRWYSIRFSSCPSPLRFDSGHPTAPSRDETVGAYRDCDENGSTRRLVGRARPQARASSSARNRRTNFSLSRPKQPANLAEPAICRKRFSCKSGARYVVGGIFWRMNFHMTSYQSDRQNT
jgi:hypothetical protein